MKYKKKGKMYDDGGKSDDEMKARKFALGNLLNLDAEDEVAGGSSNRGRGAAIKKKREEEEEKRRKEALMRGF